MGSLTGNLGPAVFDPGEPLPLQRAEWKVETDALDLVFGCLKDKTEGGPPAGHAGHPVRGTCGAGGVIIRNPTLRERRRQHKDRAR
ncbi:hypothetical protein OG384_22115 [Streptomyces sp. NBC_01324]|uniref:hypothetical protein n=1 Tax=Streptomyces sp. NBC_01324 TaxID=2903826 RepID=UPI002E164422|nr:hypothetical protein OG384_22115 [Streptomyces sp. NBC_01324]